MARTNKGTTSPHFAAYYGKSTGLIEAGADVNAKDLYGKTPWDLAQENEYLKGTKGYWTLNDARFK